MSLAIMNNAAVIIYVQVFMKCMFSLAFPDDTVVKNPPENVGVTQETGVRSLGWEDPLEKEVATHSSILAWKIPWTKEPGSMGLQRVRHD